MAAGDQRTMRDTGPAGSCLLLASAGAAVAQGRAIMINCTTSGTITLKFPDATTMTLNLAAAGQYELNYAIIQYTIGTAVATVYNLY